VLFKVALSAREEGTERQNCNHKFSRWYQPSVARDHHSIACNFIYPASLMPLSDAPWHLTRDAIFRTEIKRTLRPARMLHMVKSWTIIIAGWAKHKQTIRIDTPGRRVTPTAKLVSVPYSNPMFDVHDVSRFYRCSITDVHIGRSLRRTTTVPLL